MRAATKGSGGKCRRADAQRRALHQRAEASGATELASTCSHHAAARQHGRNGSDSRHGRRSRRGRGSRRRRHSRRARCRCGPCVRERCTGRRQRRPSRTQRQHPVSLARSPARKGDEGRCGGRWQPADERSGSGPAEKHSEHRMRTRAGPPLPSLPPSLAPPFRALLSASVLCSALRRQPSASPAVVRSPAHCTGADRTAADTQGTDSTPSRTLSAPHPPRSSPALASLSLAASRAKNSRVSAVFKSGTKRRSKQTSKPKLFSSHCNNEFPSSYAPAT